LRPSRRASCGWQDSVQPKHQTYYTTGRLDAVATQKIRLFASWLYQYQRQNGLLPHGDATDPNLVNVDAGNAPSAFAHTIGYTAPNQTMNFGADITINSHLVSTTRYGYYFENYHDFGYPTNRTLFLWQTPGCTGNPCTTAVNDNGGSPLPGSLALPSSTQTDAFSQFYTRENRNKAIQFDQDLAFFKSGWMGTHNFKFGYQLNRLQNDISQTYSEPDVQLFVGATSYSVLTGTGANNCVNQFVWTQVPGSNPAQASDCGGQFGYATVSDFGTGGNVTSFNHGIFA